MFPARMRPCFSNAIVILKGIINRHVHFAYYCWYLLQTFTQITYSFIIISYYYVMGTYVLRMLEVSPSTNFFDKIRANLEKLVLLNWLSLLTCVQYGKIVLIFVNVQVFLKGNLSTYLTFKIIIMGGENNW